MEEGESEPHDHSHSRAIHLPGCQNNLRICIVLDNGICTTRWRLLWIDLERISKNHAWLIVGDFNSALFGHNILQEADHLASFLFVSIEEGLFIWESWVRNIPGIMVTRKAQGS